MFSFVDRLFAQILQGVILPDLHNIPERNRKTVGAGFARLLLCAQLQSSPIWPALLEAELKLFLLPSTMATSENVDELEFADAEDQGFQTSYSKLAASESTRVDPAAFVGPDVRKWFSSQLAAMSAQAPQKV